MLPAGPLAIFNSALSLRESRIGIASNTLSNRFSEPTLTISDRLGSPDAPLAVMINSNGAQERLARLPAAIAWRSVVNSPAQPDPLPADELAAAVYNHLRAIAQIQMKSERAGHTLTATALVHEAYMRLSDDASVRATGRAGFVAAAAEAMRRILVEHARAKGRLKRGGGSRRVALEEIGDVADLAAAAQRDDGEGILAFDEAVRRLEAHDRRFAEVVRLRFFAGLTIAEVATVLGISERTVNNDWIYARAWLARELQKPEMG
jgi:RNA polymerase sigma factor (TIGR02999 family)